MEGCLDYFLEENIGQYILLNRSVLQVTALESHFVYYRNMVSLEECNRDLDFYPLHSEHISEIRCRVGDGRYSPKGRIKFYEDTYQEISDIQQREIETIFNSVDQND